jgi:hypothetical protein
MVLPSVLTSAAVHRAVVNPVFGEAGDAARCELLSDVARDMVGGTGKRLIRGAEGSFELYWDQPFCSTRGASAPG